ncbi:MAG: metal-dependent transcriptional regulator [Oscillospiraceae bacterium]
MKLLESGENYLETILMEQTRLGAVRSIDIANALGYSKPTISIAMKHLRENGYILVDEGGFLSLTQQGREIAEKIYERHEVIAHLLMGIGVSEAVAYTDACKIEHDISDETFRCLRDIQSL